MGGEFVYPVSPKDTKLAKNWGWFFLLLCSLSTSDNLPSVGLLGEICITKGKIAGSCVVEAIARVILQQEHLVEAT